MDRRINENSVMSFVDLPLQFQVKVNEESYNYLHLFRVRVVVYRHSSDLVDVEKADTMKANSKSFRSSRALGA
jgi:hypothetical protein